MAMDRMKMSVCNECGLVYEAEEANVKLHQKWHEYIEDLEARITSLE